MEYSKGQNYFKEKRVRKMKRKEVHGQGRSKKKERKKQKFCTIGLRSLEGLSNRPNVIHFV